MKFKDIYELFTKSTKENFPVEECTIQNKREENVYNSTTPYLCLVIDKDFKHDWYLTVLYPYICKESETTVTFGWLPEDRMNVYCNIENSTQLWDEFVVGFQKYDDTDFKVMWDDFKNKIDEQYGEEYYE
jgi:hypothetical protein